ncbi:MAG: carotenoid oxygenase [Benjaminiella poitrasii]|nr:MAG: carotenoid oxygenase [Benjaminiella poitrasii]
MFTGIIFTVFIVPLGCLLFGLYYYFNNVYNKFLDVIRTNYVPDSLEVKDPIILHVESGKIPSWLNGIMYRIGPGKFNIQQEDGSIFSIRHAFDGLPFMHRFEVNGETQTLKYNSRLLAKSVESSIEQKTYKGMIFFGHQPYMNFSRWLSNFWARIYNLVLFPEAYETLPPDGQMVGVTATPNFPLPASLKSEKETVLVAKTDANVLQKVHAETLEPQRIFSYSDFDKNLNGQFSAAHHQWDPSTNESYNFTLATVPRPKLVVFKISETGETTVVAAITHRDDQSPINPAYIHSFWLTENYLIIPESPLIVKNRGMDMLMNGSFISSMSWNSDAPTYLHVFKRNNPDYPSKSGLVASIPVPSFYTFHVGNAFESPCPTTKDIRLVLDCASFSNGDILHQLHTFGVPRGKGPYVSPSQQTQLNGITNPPDYQMSFGDLVRFELNLDQKTMVSVKTLAENVEFPRFNQAYSMKANHQYVYGCHLSRFTEKKDQSVHLVKIDLNNLSTKLYGHEGYGCSEPIFVPRPESKEEDDGVLLSLVNDFNQCCYFVIVDAKHLKEIARVKIGEFTAITFHGSYIDHEFESINVN